MADYLPIVAQQTADPELADLIVLLLRTYGWLPFIIAGVVLLFSLMEYAVLYARAGRPWWAAFIPFYSTWVHANVIGRNPLLMVIFPFLVTGASILISIVSFGFVITQAAPIVITVYGWIMLWDLAIVFNASTAVAIVTVLFPYIGPLFIIFNKNPYLGPLAGGKRRVLMSIPWVDYGLVRPGAQVDHYGNPLNPLAKAHSSYSPTAAQTYHPQGQAMMSDWTIPAQQGLPTQTAEGATPTPGMHVSPPNTGQAAPPSSSPFTPPTPQQEASMWAQPTTPPAPEPQVPNLAPSPPKPDNSENTLPPFTP